MSTSPSSSTRPGRSAPRTPSTTSATPPMRCSTRCEHQLDRPGHPVRARCRKCWHRAPRSTTPRWPIGRPARRRPRRATTTRSRRGRATSTIYDPTAGPAAPSRSSSFTAANNSNQYTNWDQGLEPGRDRRGAGADGLRHRRRPDRRTTSTRPATRSPRPTSPSRPTHRRCREPAHTRPRRRGGQSDQGRRHARCSPSASATP